MALKKKPAKKKPGLTTLAQIQEALSGASLHLPGWGIVRAVNSAQNVVAASALNANAERIKTQRVLIDTKMEEWKNLQRARSEARAWFDGTTFPYVVKGQRLFLREKKEAIWRHAAEFAEEIKTAAEALDERRDGIIQRAKEDLGDTYSPDLFPVSFAKQYALDIREHSIEPPSYLRHTNADEYQRELAKKLDDIKLSMQAYERQCMEQVGRNVGQLIASMTNPNGSPHSATLENLQKTFARISSMRYEGTAAFKAAMEEAKETLQGVSIGELRRPGGVKKRTTERLTALMQRYAELRKASEAKLAVVDSNPM